MSPANDSFFSSNEAEQKEAFSCRELQFHHVTAAELEVLLRLSTKSCFLKVSQDKMIQTELKMLSFLFDSWIYLS